MSDARTMVDEETVTKISGRSVSETVARFIEMLAAKGMHLFAVIDQAAEARKVGLALRETTMVIFGSPVAGTPVMMAVPLSALDLPLKIVVWADGNQTKVSYDAPAGIARRRGVSPDLAANLAGINGLTDALVAP